MKAHLILYVRDQALSTRFYAAVLDREPTLNVPGMTEFPLSDGCILGLMPSSGIKRLLGEPLPDPETTPPPRDIVYKAVSLSVSPENPAIRLYLRCGFEVVGMCGTSVTMRRRGASR